jgi:hypothetical protein
MISANDLFFGFAAGSESAFAGLFTTGLDSGGLLAAADETVRASFDAVERGFFNAEVGAAGDDCETEVGLLVWLGAGLSAKCGEGLGELSLDRGRFTRDSVRGAFVGAPRSCSEALRFGTTSLGRVAMVGDGDAGADFSPVIDAKRSPIVMMTEIM